MKPLSTNNADVRRVAILRIRSLGDIVLCTPAIQLIHRYRPDIEISLFVEDRFRDLCGAVSKPASPALGALREFAPDLCLNLHGGTRSARLTALSGARYKAGFDIFRPACIYNIRIPTAQEILGVTRRVHTAEHAAAAVFHLGVPVQEVPRANLPSPPGRSRHAPPGRYAVIHPLAATPEKTWPSPNFAALAAALDVEPLFVGGSGEDLSAFNKWRTVSGAPLSEIGRLMRDASLFIGNDSGPAHMAAAFGVPVAVFFGPSDPEIWRPWRTSGEVLPLSSTVTEARRAIDRLAVPAGAS